MLMSVIGWIVLVLSCWIVVGAAVGLVVGKIMYEGGKEAQSISDVVVKGSRLEMGTPLIEPDPNRMSGSSAGGQSESEAVASYN